MNCESYQIHNSDLVAKKVENLYLGRAGQFTDPGGEYRNLNLAAFYDRLRENSEDVIRLQVYSVPGMDRPLFTKAIEEAEWKPSRVGESYGPSWSTHWFKISVRVPCKWLKNYVERPILHFDSSDEGFVYLENGTPEVGLSSEHNRAEWILPESFLDGEWHDFYIETACNNITGAGSPPDPNRYFRLNTADIVVPNAAARALNYDFWIIGDAAREFPESSWQRHKARSILNRIMNTFDRNDVDKSVAKCREIAKEYLGPNIDSPNVFPLPALSRKETLETKAGVWALGNCHIDTAWLWPYAETRRKIARSWASQLDLLERYPEYVFAASQAVQFLWLKEDHPELFKRVQKAAAKGRFVTVGGSWVECDTNMPSGEALCRQMILGQNFFKKEFGATSKCFWLPDSFGYAPQLPQICRLAGQPFFLTQKLSWSQINSFPHSTFNWVGIDGSQVLCHMPPDNTYTAQAHFGDIKRSLEQHKNLDIDQHGMMLFGHGDGGGGPIAEHLEKIRRCRGLSDTVGSLLPRVHYAKDVSSFYDAILDNTNSGKDLPSWNGELYLEYHRGTYTTQAKIKQNNRSSEILMRDVELYATIASLRGKNYTYPQEKIQKLWQDVCLNQFHDVLPGSGIEMIYEDANSIYDNIHQEGTQLIEEALQSVGYKVDSHDPNERDKPTQVATRYGQPQPESKLIRFHHWKETMTSEEWAGYSSLSEGGHSLVNSHFEVEFDDKGHIVRMWDIKNSREVIDTPSNRLILYEDQPLNFPAWDVDQYVSEKYQVLEAYKIEQEGQHLHLFYKYGNEGTHIHQMVTLHHDHLEVINDVDWHEQYQLLRAEFGVRIISQVASYECAFGVHQRSTHYNTSWDAAKFEVCGHSFADLSQFDYGVAILNNSKYGYSIHGNKMQLSLLRSPKSPDAHADMGRHYFRYAIAPHKGPLGAATVRLAKDFNYWGRWATGNRAKAVELVSLSGDESVFVSSVKRPFKLDSGRKEVVVRLYEALGGSAVVELNVNEAIKSAVLVNLFEEPISGPIDVLSNSYHECVRLEFKPFEVKTVLLDLGV